MLKEKSGFCRVFYGKGLKFVYVEYHKNRFKKENLEILLFWKILKRQRATLFQSEPLKIIYDTMKTEFSHHRGKYQKLKK